MSEFKYAYPPNPIHGAPKFFKRDWPGPAGLAIYGYAIRSTYKEDESTEEFAWRRNQSFLSYAYSEACPDGEMGFTRNDAVEEISEEEFLAAAERSWL